MFVLAELSDVVCIPPYQFRDDPNAAIVMILNSKLSNRVLPNVGLCISVWQVEKVGDAHLLPGNPGYQVLVSFTALVFRPFIDEVLTGKIKSSSVTEGIQLSVSFFEDIQVPVEQLPAPSKWDENRSTWYWEYSDSPEDHNQNAHKLYMNAGSTVRFRVVGERFVDKTPKPGSLPVGSDKTVRPASANSGEGSQYFPDEEADAFAKLPPYSITASLVDSGLGPLSWWSGS